MNVAVPEPPSFVDMGCLSQMFGNNSTDVRPSQLFPPSQKVSSLKRKKDLPTNFDDATSIPVGDTLDDIFASSQPRLDQSKPSQGRQAFNTRQPKGPYTSTSLRPWDQKKTQKPTRYTKPIFRPPVRPSPPLSLDSSPELTIENVPSPPQKQQRYGSSQIRDGYNSQEDMFQSQAIPAGTPATFTRDSIYAPQPLVLPGVTPGGQHVKINNLRSVEEIPSAYRSVFSFPYFNIVQSKVFDDVFYRDNSLVVCAPTGSGKTCIFELAIVRIMIKMKAEGLQNQFKVVYMAPMKALCSERCDDWKTKFQSLGLKCMELTGDTDIDDWFELQNVNIIMTTPEKWDSMTRKWRDNKSLVQHVKLFLVDEIHMLHDDTRGATMEAVVSRMKTVQATFDRNSSDVLPMRFVAVSATAPNVDDIADWLGSKNVPAEYYRMDDSYRPVKLRKVVLGYPCSENQTDFKFDLSLNYKLATVIQTYSEQKPTLVFCATRKGVQQAASTLVKDARFIMNAVHKEKLIKYSGRLRDSKLRDLVLFGVGYHHAGLEMADRKLIEEIFLNGELPVLLSTSTLAMGVNLPAHLVVVKSTQHYVMGMYQEYSETQVLQMIGRAGRPQFDTSATAVIMTRYMTKSKYENLLNGAQVIESSLHKHLIEHVNAEVVLNTITDVSVAVEWLRSTFLYIRVLKNPKHYGIDVGLTTDEVEKYLQEICMKSLKSLSAATMIELDEQDQFDVKPTDNGRIMARYCVPYDTMKEFVQITGMENLKDLVDLVSACKSYDIQLRMNERRTLNTMNKDKNRITIRFPMEGKIKTSLMKVNCLIQAQLGCLSFQDFALAQDTIKIFRVGTRLARCLVEILWNRNELKALLNALLLSKSFKSRIWENSKYVSRQLDGIGPQISNALVNAAMVTFQSLEEANPRDLEMIVNRHPPFGNNVRDSVIGLPKYEVMVEQSATYSSQSAELNISIKIVNADALKKKETAGANHSCALVIGDTDNKVVHKVRLSDNFLMKIGTWTKRLNVQRSSKGDELSVNYISQEWVGLDVQSTYTPLYLGVNKCVPKPEPGYQHQTPNPPTRKTNNKDNRRPCSHRCINKAFCGHDCCKQGIQGTSQTWSTESVPNSLNSGKRTKPELIKLPRPRVDHVESCRSEMKHRMDGVAATPNLKRLKPRNDALPPNLDLQNFAFTPQQKMPATNPLPASPRAAQTPSSSSNGWEVLDLYHKRSSKRNNFQENQDIVPEFDGEDTITAAMAQTGYGNFESGYFDDIGDEAEMMQVAEAVDEPNWDDSYLPDPRMPRKQERYQTSSNRQFSDSTICNKIPTRGNFDSSHDRAQWSSLSQLQGPERTYTKGPARSAHVDKASEGPSRGWSKSSPVSISDDDFEPEMEAFQKPKARFGQVFAWSKSSSDSKGVPYLPSQDYKTKKNQCLLETSSTVHGKVPESSSKEPAWSESSSSSKSESCKTKMNQGLLTWLRPSSADQGNVSEISNKEPVWSKLNSNSKHVSYPTSEHYETEMNQGLLGASGDHLGKVPEISNKELDWSKSRSGAKHVPHPHSESYQTNMDQGLFGASGDYRRKVSEISNKNHSWSKSSCDTKHVSYPSPESYKVKMNQGLLGASSTNQGKVSEIRNKEPAWSKSSSDSKHVFYPPSEHYKTKMNQGLLGASSTDQGKVSEISNTDHALSTSGRDSKLVPYPTWESDKANKAQSQLGRISEMCSKDYARSKSSSNSKCAPYPTSGSYKTKMNQGLLRASGTDQGKVSEISNKEPSWKKANSFTSAKRVYESTRLSLTETDKAPSPGFSCSSDDDDLLASFVSSQEQHFKTKEVPVHPAEIRSGLKPHEGTVSGRKPLVEPKLNIRPPLTIPEPECKKKKLMSNFFGPSTSERSGNEDDLTEAENTFSGIFADIF